MKDYSEILKECAKVASQRQKSYGKASKSLQDVSNILLESFGIEMTPETICKVLISLKLARTLKTHHRDSWIDIINYAAILTSLYDSGKKRK